ncbi:MAG: outer membrane beta-barrel protein [Bacteroidia bacterium]
MKKIALLIGAITCVCMLQAQQGLKIGVRVGPTFTSTNFLDATTKTVLEMNQSGSSGYTFGIVANQGFSENYAFHTGFHIVRKGFTYDINLGDSTNSILTNRVNNVTTLEIPLGLKLRTNEIGSGVHVMGRFGATVDLNVGFRQTETTGGEPPIVNQRSNQINKIGGAFFAGVGAEYEKEWGTLAFDVSYHHGLANINNKRNGIPNANVRLRYFALGLSYFF